MKKNEFKNIALDGLARQNPVFRLILGTCPTLALSTAVLNGIGMGVAVIFVLVFSNLIISLLRSVIPDKVRIPAFIMVIATFVTIVDMTVAKYLPDLYSSLGVYLPLIVVNCIILGRAESFASSNKPVAAIFDGLFMGCGYTLALVLMCTVREILGAGSFLGIKLWDFSIPFFSKSAGAFLTYGLLLCAFNVIYNAVVKARKKKLYGDYMKEKYADISTEEVQA
ncbi:MAG: electron transport complex subunit E [Clostridia bacterium]|nr:electron transport complex subunit E [Clostridia bacterium]